MSNKPYRLAVRAAILDGQGRSLLLRRSKVCRHFVGQWEWPGGKVDDGETVDVALCREVQEETGLEVELRGVVGAFGFEMDQARVATLCIVAEVTGGSFKVNEEHDEHSWVPVAEVPQWDLVRGLADMARAFAASVARKGAE